MANLFNFLTGMGDKIQNNGFFQKLIGQNETKDFISSLPNTISPEQLATSRVNGLQMEENKGIRPIGFSTNEKVNLAPLLVQESNQAPQKVSWGQKLSNALLGTPQEVDNDIEKHADSDGIKTGISNTPRKGGILRDISGGYQENRFAPVSLDNLAPNENKGFAYRIGEGLGSLARFGNSPLGRGLITGGAIAALGGSPAQILGYGAGATMLNQGNVMRDRIYRDDLINSQQNSLRNSKEFQELSQDDQEAQLKAIADKINGIRGYVDPMTYSNMQRAQQLKDNQSYRNLVLANQMQNQKDMMNYRIAQAQRDAKNDAWQRDYNERKLASDNIYKQGMVEAKQNSNKNIKKQQDAIANLNAVNEQLRRFEDTFEDMPNKLDSNTLGRLRSATGFQMPKEANFNSQRTLLFNKIARDLGGEKGVLSDQDIKRIEASLPTLTDSLQQKKAKMQAINDLLNDRYNTLGTDLYSTQRVNAELADNDPLGIL